MVADSPEPGADPFDGITVADPKVARTADDIRRKVRRIRSWVEGHPGAAASVRKLESDYLPQAAKLLRAYAELGHAGVDACGSLRDVLSKFDAALDGIYRSLVSAEAMDAVAEADVFAHILEQDGCTASPFGGSDGGDAR